MASSKISALAAEVSPIASGDLFVIVDVSDNTMAASGTDKKLTFSLLKSEILGTLTANYVVYSASSTALGQDANFTWTPATGLLNLKHMGVGANSVISDQYMLHVNETTAAASPIGVYSDLIHTSTSLATTIIGISSRVNQSGGASIGGATVGISSEVILNSAVNFPSNTINGLILSAQSTASQTGTVATYSHQLFYTPVWTGSKPAAMYGSYYQNLGASGITNSYGIYILAQSGSTNNYGLVSLSNKNGFGLSAPTATVEIVGSGTGSGTFSFITQNSASTASLKFSDVGVLDLQPSTLGYRVNFKQPNANDAFKFYLDDAGNEFQMLVGGAEKILFRTSGASYFVTGNNFGIGLNNPTSRFHFKAHTTDNTVGFKLVDSADVLSFFVQNDGYVVQRAINAAIPNTDLTNSQMSFYIDETGNTLTVKVKYAGGTVKTGTVALV